MRRRPFQDAAYVPGVHPFLLAARSESLRVRITLYDDTTITVRAVR